VSIAAIVEDLHARLLAAADPGRAPTERAYLKSDLTHLGAGVPATRRAVKTTLAEHGPFGHDDLVAVVDALWAEPLYERRLAAVELLTASTSPLSVADAVWLEHLLRACRTWALLDPLVIGVVGVLTEQDAGGWDAVVRRWADEEDHWLRRAALLAHLPALRRGEGDWERFAELADRMLGEREFFVRKAIGWVLRETAKRRPRLVADWLEPRAHRAAGLTIREAVKPLPAEDRDRILAARPRAAPG
jgi:3-methyladenine DNA glycosylase AlkD